MSGCDMFLCLTLRGSRNQVGSPDSLELVEVVSFCAPCLRRNRIRSEIPSHLASIPTYLNVFLHECTVVLRHDLILNRRNSAKHVSELFASWSRAGITLTHIVPPSRRSSTATPGEGLLEAEQMQTPLYPVRPSPQSVHIHGLDHCCEKGPRPLPSFGSALDRPFENGICFRNPAKITSNSQKAFW